MSMMRDCILFDLDGTLADASHRLHYIKGPGPKDWTTFFAEVRNDPPIGHMVTLFRALDAAGMRLVIVSGRSDASREDTLAWLNRHRLYWFRLFMRKQGDHRPDDVVKREFLIEVRNQGLNPIMAFEDRNRVVEMWRSQGIPCAQVAPGDF